LLGLLSVSGAESQETPNAGSSERAPVVDRGPAGAPYVSGQLLVNLERNASGAAVEARSRGAGGRVEDRPPDIDTMLLSFPAIANERVREARERALERVRENLDRAPGVESAEYNYVRQTDCVPNDPLFGKEYGLKRPGYPQAWNKTRGKKSVRIGIVDSGIDARHPDLRGKIAAKRDFAPLSSGARDEVGHGAHVAGIAAAVTNNRRGVAGGCPNCRLLIAKSVGQFGGSDTYIAKGINWTVNNGADVLNLSLGGPQRSTTLERAVNRGTVVVAAAGNDGDATRNYPVAYPRVMAVGVTNASDRRARFSNRGKWLSVTAPGVGIVSTVPGNSYERQTGTSMSSPNVAGLAGLLASRNLSNAQVRGRIQNTAVDLGSNGKDAAYGYGRISAARAVR
jgi:thermitase